MKLLFNFLLLYSLTTASEGQSYWTAHSKQIVKELTGWSPEFAKADHLKTTDSREFYKISALSGASLGTLVLSSAPGRFERFDVMVVLEPGGKIALIRILKYRSEYGSEITNKKWLAQFYGKPGGEFTLHKNIDAISGATYSSNGLVQEINLILKLLKPTPAVPR